MDLTNKFSLDKIKDILLLPLKNVNNTELLRETVNKDVSGEYGDFMLSVGGEAGVRVQLFNDVDDDNQDSVAAALEIDKEIENGSAFLGYELSGKIKGGLKADLDYVSLGLSKVNEFTHKSYLKHDSLEPVAQAIANDIVKFKLALDWESIKNLKNFEAVSMTSKNSLDFDVEVSVSDTFTPLLSVVSKLLGAKDAIGVKIDMSASLKVNISIADNFQTVIQRRDDQNKKRYLLDIKKGSKDTKQVTAALAVTAAISNPEVLMNTINSLVNRAEKGLSEQVEKLKDKTWDKLSDSEKDLVKLAAKAIGIDPDKVEEDLLKKYKEKRDSIISEIKKSIDAELKLSVSYTYEKAKEKQSMLKGSFTEATLQSCFQKVLHLQINEIYSYSKGNTDEIKVIDYFDLTRISITRATKIGFSISQFELSQLVKKTVEFEDQIMADHGDPEIQSVNFSSSKFTTEKLGVFKERENSMILSGSYRGEVISNIHMGNLDYEFSLHWAETFKHIKDSQLKKVIDLTATWGIIEEQSFQTQLSTISELLRDREEIKASAFVKLKIGLFDSLIDSIANLSDYTFQQTLAAAVPYADYDGRRTPTNRKDYYYSFFNRYLKEHNGSNIDYEKAKDLIVAHLQTNGKNDLANFEASNDLGDYVQIKRLLEHNFMAFQFGSFKNAIALLNNGTKDFKSVIQSSEFLHNLNSIRLQPEFNMRFLGRLLVQLAYSKGIGHLVERSLVLDYKDGSGKDNKFVLAR